MATKATHVVWFPLFLPITHASQMCPEASFQLGCMDPHSDYKGGCEELSPGPWVLNSEISLIHSSYIHPLELFHFSPKWALKTGFFFILNDPRLALSWQSRGRTDMLWPLWGTPWGCVPISLEEGWSICPWRNVQLKGQWTRSVCERGLLVWWWPSSKAGEAGRHHVYIFIQQTFSECLCVLGHFSHVWLFETWWTIAHQAPLPMGFF